MELRISAIRRWATRKRGGHSIPTWALKEGETLATILSSTVRRIGCTAFTYQHATWNDVALYPKAGLLGQLEGGVRGRYAFISIYTLVMNWGQSDVVRDMLQPYSQMFTIGLQGGFCF